MLVATMDGLFQALGVASILPFIAVLADPAILDRSPWFAAVRSQVPGLETQNLVFITGLFAFVMLLLSNALTVLDYWLSLKVFNRHRHRLSLSLLRHFLNQDLLSFNRRKVSVMSTTVLSEVERVVIDTLMAGVGMLADLIVIVAVAAVLVYVNPVATLFVLLLLGGGYLVIHLFTVREMERLGATHAEAEGAMFAGVSQALTLYKEARLANRVDYFLERFAIPSRRIVDVTNRYEMLTFVPAQILELLTFGLMLGVAVYLTDGTTGRSETIALIAFFAFAAYRLIPILSSLLDGFETFRYGASVVDNVLDVLHGTAQHGDGEARPAARQALRDRIDLDGISFRYPGAPGDTLDRISATIPVGQLTCIVGPSGAGKSTLLDILSGLLPPSGGSVRVDGRPLARDDLPGWQAAIAYVPQQVQLLDASLAENIALGETEIDMQRVGAAAEAAALDRLVAEQLPDGYATPIGDGGHALSSGERQRVGIARALYRQPDLLLLDEATNELDAATEALVMQRIRLDPNRTLVFATHKREIHTQADHVIELPGHFS
jgi:ATP-binding cassette, subfamily B, bacterial PglK